MPDSSNAAGRHSSDTDASHAKRKRRRWPWVTGILAVIVIIAAAAVVFAVQALSVKDDLTSAKSEVNTVMKAVKKGDAAAVQAAADKVSDLTTHANETVQGPLWTISAAIPFIGRNVDAVRTAAEATHTLVEGAMPAGVKMLDTMKADSLTVKGGGINLEPLKQAEKTLPTINKAFGAAQTQLDSVDRTKILPVVDNAISPLFDVMDETAPLLKSVEQYLPALLDIAGADGPRSYLLIFQNNAETRSTGGLPAATAQVNMDDGKIALGKQTSTYSFRRDQQVIDLPTSTLGLYDTDTFSGFGNFTRTPNFPTTAKAFDALWYNTYGEKLDGVFSIDPVVLSHVLKVTGPVTVDDGTKLTSANVVDELLYKAYVRYPSGTAQDLFFADVAARVFMKVAGGGWDVMKMYNALHTSADEQRLYLWFANDDEQAMSVDLGLDGQLKTTNKETTQVGIFLNDYAASKLEYFLTSKVAVTCNPDARTITTSVTVTNNLSANDEMTSYQLGIRNNRYGIPRTSFILDVMYFAPPGTKIDNSDPADGDDPSATKTGTEDKRDVESMRIFVAEGETRTVSFTSTLSDAGSGPVSVRYTPTAASTPVTVAKSCAALSTPAS
ncbi:DUF4012 domain-containing protein [Microbacterium horticulturae]|uniref:DUF4012 domain-containing protein n=1 Tax=Microbacterium horticulturae TaxID=3028316 RepID=A0ABY8BXY4_9MICO|nr:DUF4012 domain-containing protein [Microbacterium sp. KACC 23027]WEG07890.1 DUF4012 domain-containing protein [Microbacterium sp. KACC 23027]